MTSIISQQTWTHEGRPDLTRRDNSPAPGPWMNEPDKVQWIDGDTDLDCLAVRNSFGSWCGYVGVPSGHPLHGKGYSECLDDDCTEDYCYEHTAEANLRVHGGLTFASSCDETAKEGHGICHVPLPGRDPDVWWLGFDCAHSGDLSPTDLSQDRPYRAPGAVYRDLAYVQDQVASLAEQIGTAPS